jgi:hypothetical protein
MIDWHGLNTGGHILAGTLALAVGLVPMFTRKGGVLHRQAGYVTVALGLIVLGSAVIANILFDPPAPLVAATLSAGYQYLSGMRAAYLKAGPLKPLDIALAVCGLALCGLLWANVAHGSASWSPQIGYSTLGYILVILIYDLSRTFWMSVWHRHVRLLDHGLKMIGFYFAVGRRRQPAGAVAAAEPVAAVHDRSGGHDRLRRLVRAPSHPPARPGGALRP